MPAGGRDGGDHVLSYNRRRIPKTITTPPIAVDAPAGLRDHLSEAWDQSRSCGAEPKSFRRPPSPAISAWRTGGVPSGRDRRPLEGQLDRCSRFRSPERGGDPEHDPLGPRVLQRTGIRTALAYLRMGLDSGCDAARGRRPDDPTALSGDRPQRDQDALGTDRDLGRGHQTPGRPPLGTRRTQAVGLRRLSRFRCRCLSNICGRPHCGPSASRSVSGRRWTYSIRLGGRRIDRPTPTTSWPSSRWRTSTQTWPPSKSGSGPCSNGDQAEGPDGAPVDDPQDQRSRVGARHRLRRLAGTAPAPSERRRGGGAARLPRGAHPSRPPGARVRRCRRSITFCGRARWQQAS